MNKKELAGWDLVITFIDSTQESSSINMEEGLDRDEIKQREKDSDDLESFRDFVTRSLLTKGELIKEITSLKQREARLVNALKLYAHGDSRYSKTDYYGCRDVIINDSSIIRDSDGYPKGIIEHGGMHAREVLRQLEIEL